MRRKDTVVAVD